MTEPDKLIICRCINFRIHVIDHLYRNVMSS